MGHAGPDNVWKPAIRETTESGIFVQLILVNSARLVRLSYWKQRLLPGKGERRCISEEKLC